MIIPKFGTWNNAAFVFFTYQRIFWRGHLLPLCRIRYRRTKPPWAFRDRVRYLLTGKIDQKIYQEEVWHD